MPKFLSVSTKILEENIKVIEKQNKNEQITKNQVNTSKKKKTKSDVL